MLPYGNLLIKLLTYFMLTLFNLIEPLLNPIESLFDSINSSCDRIIFCFKPLKPLINLIKVVEDISKFLIVLIEFTADCSKFRFNKLSVKLA